MDKLKIYTYSTLIVAIALAFYLVSSIKYSIDEEARIDKAESLIIDNLKIIFDLPILKYSTKLKKQKFILLMRLTIKILWILFLDIQVQRYI